MKTCPHCHSFLVPWKEGASSIEPTGFDESCLICTNNECSYYLDGFDVVRKYIGTSGEVLSHRYMVDGAENELSVLTSIYDDDKTSEYLLGNSFDTPETEMETETKTEIEKKYNQAFEPYRFDLINPTTMLEIAHTLHIGACKYGDYGYKTINKNEHVARAMLHLYKWQECNVTENHLIHAICRLMFAYEDSLPHFFKKGKQNV